MLPESINLFSQQCLLPHQLSQATNHWSLSTAVVRSGLRPSLVQGLRPRNAPLQKHASPTVCLHRNVSAGEHDRGCTPVASPRAWM